MALSGDAIFDSFNLATGVSATRKMLKTLVNVGTPTAKVWEWLGDGVEESTIDFTPDAETTTDVKGVTRTLVKSLEVTQTFDPMTVTGGSTLQLIMEGIISRNAKEEFNQFEIMIVKDYITVDSKSYAEVHSGCTIYPTSLGGDSYVDMPIDITFSNNKVLGSYDATTGTFTETI